MTEREKENKNRNKRLDFHLKGISSRNRRLITDDDLLILSKPGSYYEKCSPSINWNGFSFSGK